MQVIQLAPQSYFIINIFNNHINQFILLFLWHIFVQLLGQLLGQLLVQFMAIIVQLWELLLMVKLCIFYVRLFLQKISSSWGIEFLGCSFYRQKIYLKYKYSFFNRKYFFLNQPLRGFLYLSLLRSGLSGWEELRVKKVLFRG